MSIDWKSRFKKTFKARLVIAGLIFAVVGWFLLGVMLFGRFFEEELLEIMVVGVSGTDGRARLTM